MEYVNEKILVETYQHTTSKCFYNQFNTRQKNKKYLKMLLFRRPVVPRRIEGGGDRSFNMSKN